MTLTDRVNEMEKLIGSRPVDDFPDLITRSLDHEERLIQLEQAVSSTAKEAGPSIPPAGWQDQRDALLEGFLDRMKELEEEVAMLRRICSHQPPVDQAQQSQPHDVAWVARDSLKKLKQTGSNQEYVKEFRSLLLDIQDMSEADKLFNFQSGLKNWAQVKLRRQGVKDLPSAMAAAESFADFKSVLDPALGDKKKFQAKESKQASPKKKGKKKKPDARKKETTQTPKPSSTSDRPLECYLCKGAHRIRDCPKKGRLAAMVSKLMEEEERSEGEPSRVNPMQALNVLVAKKSAPCKGLLHVSVKVNGRKLQAMLDSGSTDSLIDDQIARDLGLARSTSATLVKTVNAKAAKVHGIAKATVEIGPWVRACSFMILPLDDFQMILGLDFFRAAKGAIVPHLNGMFIGAEECPGFVSIIQHGAMKAKEEDKKEAGKIGSSKHIVHGVQESHMAYAATLRQVMPEKMEMVVTTEVGEDPRALPPRCYHDQRIGHERGVRPLAKVPQCTAAVEDAEPHERRDKVLGAGMIQPSRPPLEFSSKGRLVQHMARRKPSGKEVAGWYSKAQGLQGHGARTDTRAGTQQAGRAVCSTSQAQARAGWHARSAQTRARRAGAGARRPARQACAGARRRERQAGAQTAAPDERAGTARGQPLRADEQADAHGHVHGHQGGAPSWGTTRGIEYVRAHTPASARAREEGRAQGEPRFGQAPRGRRQARAGRAGAHSRRARNGSCADGLQGARRRTRAPSDSSARPAAKRQGQRPRRRTRHGGRAKRATRPSYQRGQATQGVPRQRPDRARVPRLCPDRARMTSNAPGCIFQHPNVHFVGQWRFSKGNSASASPLPDLLLSGQRWSRNSSFDGTFNNLKAAVYGAGLETSKCRDPVGVPKVWIEDDLRHARGGKLVVPMVKDLRCDVFKVFLDSKWAQHPEDEEMHALFSRDSSRPFKVKRCVGDLTSHVSFVKPYAANFEAEGRGQPVEVRPIFRSEFAGSFTWILADWRMGMSQGLEHIKLARQRLGEHWQFSDIQAYHKEFAMRASAIPSGGGLSPLF